MADDLNPRQFSSLDDSGLGGSLTNRPATGRPASEPIDYAIHFDIERQLISYQKQNGTYVKRSSAGEEYAVQEAKAERDAAFRARVEQDVASQQLAAQREQAQRKALFDAIKGEQGTPHPYDSESDRNRIRRLNNLPPIDEPPVSTPNRQPPPSTGRPAPTPNGTAGRASALVEPTATPGSMVLAERIPPPSSGGFFNALPRSLPQAAGRFAIPGAFAVGDFAVRTFQGQSVTQAAAGAVAGGVGAAAGGYVGAAAGTLVAGPIGGYVGAIVGGYIGGYVGGAGSDYFFQRPSPGTPPVEIPNYPPFRGGQASVTYNYNFWSGRMLRQYGGNVYSFSCVGPIVGFKALYILNTDERVYPPAVNYYCEISFPNGTTLGGSVVCDKEGDLPFLILQRVDSKPDPDIIAPAPPPDNKPYYLSGTFPLNEENTIPSGSPAAGKNKGKNRDVVPGIPANNTPNSTGAYFPGHGGLAPSHLPNPTQTPSNLGGMLASTAPAPTPLPFAEPKDLPPPRFAPAPEGSISSTPGGSASSNPGISALPDPNVSRIENGVVTSPPILTAQPIPLGSSPVTIPGGLPTTKKQNPTPDAISPTPKAETAPTPKTPEGTADKTSQIIQQQKKDFDKQIEQLTTIGGLIAGLTPIIQGIPDAIAKSPTVQAANRKTTQGAVCEIAQPGGCLGDALDNSAEKINQNNNKNTNNLLDKINASANAAQLALLELMNRKLGDLIPGGLSGKLQRLSSWMHLDRVLNILIWWQTLHNAYMLSANLGQTLTSAISNVLAAIGIKDAEGSPLNIGEILGHEFDSLAKSVIGESEWGGIKAEYKKWNRIYQAAANLLNAVQSIGYSIISALEVVGSYVALIGNALRKWGEVGESAYRWFNPQPNFHNKFFTTLEGTSNVVSQVDQVASEVLSVEDNVTQIGQLKNELNKSLSEAPESKQSTIPPEATKVKAGFDASKSASATGLQLNDKDFEPDDGE